MRKIGTFLIGSALIAGAIFCVPHQGTSFISNVNAAGIINPLKDTDDGSATVTITSVPDADKKSASYYATPKLVVTGRDIDGESVKAGDKFKMTIHLKNESTSTKLRNIELKLSTEENQIITTSGSDSIYIDSLDKEDACDVTVEMKAREDLEQKNYTVNINYNYEDNSKNSFEGSGNVTIPVVQEARLGISEVKLSKSELDVDGKTSLSLKVNNMGLDTIRNVDVEFSGDTIQEVSYYVGTVEAGASGNVDMTISPDKVGNDDIHIKVTYEDTSGNVNTYEDSVALVVNEAKPEETAEVAEPTGVSTAVLGGAAVAVILLITIIATVVKRINQKKYE